MTSLADRSHLITSANDKSRSDKKYVGLKVGVK